MLGITYNVISYWQKIGPGVTALALVPESGIWTLIVGALIAIVVAFAYQREPRRAACCVRRARIRRRRSRSGIHVHRAAARTRS